jgi:hypothetical protein
LDQGRLRRRSSLARRTKLHERRRRLFQRIAAYNRNADHFLGNFDFDQLPLLNKALAGQQIGEDNLDSDEESSDFTGEESVDGDGADSDSEGSDNDNGEVEWAENLVLAMPSTLGADGCHNLGLSNLMQQEIKLREGQANDALEELRTALAEKSLLYRMKIRGRPSQKTATRSWNAIKRANGTIRKHVKTYNIAHFALLNMHANLGQFEAILKDDLKMSGDVVEENRFGQRRDTLAWFWKVGPERRDREGS